MIKKVKRFLVGKPLKNTALNDEKFGVLWGLPILSSDAISSVAYAGQEMLIVLIPAIGMLAFGQLTILSSAIIGLLFILMLSYRQTIQSYPNGGGAYIVSKENIGLVAGVTAGAALSVDYVLTVAVSVASGVEQITSVLTFLKPHSTIFAVALVILLMIGNLRGISESSKIFGLPAYAFIFGILSMLTVGFFKVATGYVPPAPVNVKTLTESPTTMFMFLIMIKAFSSGCTALTGIEAVSNAVPNFKEPQTKHAKMVLTILAFIILILFGGTSILGNIYRVNPGEKAMLVLIAEQIFNHGFMYYYISITTFIILIMAANTAYSGFPLLISVISKDGYAPRQLCQRGDRLAYDNGIIMLSVVAALLIIAFRANVTSLLGLYAIGVFISFTLSQFGMFLRWRKVKGEHWQIKAFINGFGSFVTSIVVIIIAFTKFNEGAWLVVILIPILIFLMLKVKKHYKAVYKQLRIKPEEFANVNISKDTYRNRVIVPIESINKSSVRALRYAKTISDNIIAFSVAIDEESALETQTKYEKLNSGIPLKIRYSPYRKVVEPLLKFIQSEEYAYQKGDMITVILPQFKVKKWWHSFIHNNTRYYIEKELLKHKHIVVSTIPLQLKDDDEVLNNPN